MAMNLPRKPQPTTSTPRRLATLACLLLLAGTATRDVVAQSGSLNRNTFESLGLVRAWTTQSAATGDQELRVTFHLSQTRIIHVFDVVSPQGRQTFAEGTVSPRGVLMNEAEAQRQADIAMRMLQLDGIEASIESREVPEVSLMLQTASGLVEAIDAETGRIKWQVALGQPGHYGYAPGVSDKYVAAVSGSTLALAEIDTGKLIIEQPLDGIPGGGPILTPRYAIVPLYQSAMQAFPLDPMEAKRGPTWIKSFGKLSARPIVAGGLLSWPTDRPAVYFADVAEAVDLFRVRTRARISGRVAFAPPNLFFVSTEDGYLICIDSEREALIWDYLMGASCVGTPYVLGESVFAVTNTGQVHCLDTKLGLQRWVRSGVLEVVVGFEDRVYCRMVGDQIVAIDVESGDLLARAAMPSMATVIPNTLTDRLYFASAGRITCYREASQPWPTIYGQLETETAETRSEETAETTEDETETPATPTPATDETPAENPFEGDNPFGADPAGDDNPFGGDDDPFGSGDDDVDDPFGL